jgi:hypothetical protein
MAKIRIRKIVGYDSTFYVPEKKGWLFFWKTFDYYDPEDNSFYTQQFDSEQEAREFLISEYNLPSDTKIELSIFEI